MNKLSYELSEAENCRLRRCLAWAGALLTQPQRAELAQMIRNKIVEDGPEECEEYLAEFKSDCVKAADLLQEVIDAEGRYAMKGPVLKDRWYAEADALATKLRSFEPPSVEANLASIRNTKNIEEKLK